VLLDTGIVIELFQSSEDSPRLHRMNSAMGGEELFISIVQIAELADWAERNGEVPEGPLELVRDAARVVPLSEAICLQAASIKRKRRLAGHNRFGLLDGVVLATARSMGQSLLTLDKDFLDEPDCVVIP